MLTLDSSFVIAEAGTCHLGDIELAIEYVEVAADAGADAVKFQWFNDPNPETMFCWIDGDEERSERWKASALSLEEWREVKREADKSDIILLASAFEYETVRWLSELELEATKVASRAAGDLEPFKDAPRPLLVSNGMYEVTDKDVVPIECEANYPSTRRWSGVGGFSDHSGNPWRAIDAMARGCKLVEVHFYIDPNEAGPDLPASLSPSGLKLICEARDAFNAM